MYYILRTNKAMAYASHAAKVILYFSMNKFILTTVITNVFYLIIRNFYSGSEKGFLLLSSKLDH
jgi:hypothetical protein